MSQIQWTPSYRWRGRRVSEAPIPIKDLPKDERDAYQRWCGKKHRQKKSSLTQTRVPLDTDAARKNREKARKSYHNRKAIDTEAVLSRNRENQRRVRNKKKWGPVQHLVSAAIKSVLKPYKEADRMQRRAEYEKRNLLARRMRAYLRAVLKRAQAQKAATTMQLVGCTIQKYNEHMEAQLPPGTTMKSMSCDHIFPLSMYDLRHRKQQFMANHYTNLQPLPQGGKGGNSSKRNNLPTKAEASKVEKWAWPNGVSWDMLPEN
jgi:hypothetical protein